MLRLVRSLPAPVEFAIVIVIAFGSFIYISAVEFLGGPMADAAGAESLPYETDESLIALVVHEITVFAIVAVFLGLRGWRLRDFDMRCRGGSLASRYCCSSWIPPSTSTYIRLSSPSAKP